MTAGYRTTFHRDGTVTFWDVFAQVWHRLDITRIPDKLLATLPQPERDRIEKSRVQARRDGEYIEMMAILQQIAADDTPLTDAASVSVWIRERILEPARALLARIDN